MSTEAIILIVSVALNILLSCFIFVRNPKNLANRVFASFGLSVILWIIFNFLADNVASKGLLFTRLTLVFGACIAMSLIMLSTLFPRKIGVGKKITITFYLYFAVTVVLCMTPLFVSSVTHTSVGADLKVAPLYYVYPVFFIFSLSLLLVNFRRQSKEGTNIEKSQIKLLALGIVVYAIFAILSNVVLPIIVNNWSSSRYGPIFTIPFIGITGYAMIRHRLFDIRLAVARSMAYALTLAITTFVFILPVIILTTDILHTPLKPLGILVLGIVAFIVANIYGPLSSVFSKASNKLFYRDFYELQDVIDSLGNLLVRSVDPEEIRIKSKLILENALRPSSLVYLLDSDDLSDENRQLFTSLKRRHDGIVVFDELHVGKDETLLNQLRINNFVVAVRLRTTDEILGYMLLGYKKSGSIYTDTDKRLLTIAADEIAISLQNALRFEEIQNFNITLQEKVDDATRNLRKVNEKLKVLDETKDDFISMASHQLRTPLTSVKGYISMVLEEDAGTVTKLQKEMLGQAFFSSQRMVYLISDLLNVSRLKTGKFIIEPAPVDLSEVVQQELSQLQETAASRSLKLVYEKPKSFPTLMFDETKTRQVIMNFVDNAIYYTPAGGQVEVKLIDNPETIELRVVDNGIGVPKSEQPHMFSKFYRAGNARKARPDGTGLGLFMAKKVIIAEGGSVIFESEEGKGSSFGFVFSKQKLEVKSDQKLTPKPEPK